MRNGRAFLSRLRSQPALHFLLLGAALFWLRTGFAPPPAAGPAAPSDEELLYREALRRGLDQDLPARRRLVQDMRFLALAPAASDGQLLRQAREIGLEQSDPVVRRYLVEKMRLLARSGSAPEAFTSVELESYLEAHPERFSLPPFVRLTQVFLSADRRGSGAAPAAERLLARLRRERISPREAPALGDPFPLGAHTGMVAARDLEPVYGGGFARAVMALPVAAWCGPIESAQGWHLVWVHAAQPARLAALAEVRSQVVQALAAERGKARLAETLNRLRTRAEEVTR